MDEPCLGPTPAWRSLNRHVTASEQEEAKEIALAVAREWINELPMRSREAIKAGEWLDQPLVRDLQDPSPADVAGNFMFLRPICCMWPMRNPSVYTIADAVFLMNLELEGKLMSASEKHQETLCVLVANTILKCMTKLRRLNRWPEQKSKNAIVMKLRNLLNMAYQECNNMQVKELENDIEGAAEDDADMSQGPAGSKYIHPKHFLHTIL